ncbi:MAG: VRR-NUC domain-containing protein [Nitrospirota bacterium]
MNSPPWLSAIRPIVPCSLEPLKLGTDLLAWHVTLGFAYWIPQPGVEKPPRSETYGKTLIVSPDGTWTVAEIELVRRMRESGWQAGWVDTFGSAPKKWVEWIVEPTSLPSPLRESYQTITWAAGRNGGGKPDIVAWRGESLADAVFLEYKGPKDRVRVGQDAWFRTALREGMSRDQFAIARWSKQHSLRS